MGVILFKVKVPNITTEIKEKNLIIKPDGLGRGWVNFLIEDKMLITEELLAEAFALVNRFQNENPDIIITSSDMAKKLAQFPSRFSSIMFLSSVFNSSADQSKADCIKYLKELPEFITQVHFDVKHKWNNPEDVIKAIPKHVTHFKINLDVIANCTHEELIRFFSNFPKHLTEISLLEGNPQNNLVIDDKVLRDLIIRLPVSVKTLTVPNDMNVSINIPKRTLDLDEYRKREYFPASYDDLFCSDDLFENAQNLLNDYTKNTSCSPGFSLFFTFHWNRHHVDKVNEIVKKSTNINDLLDNFRQIEEQKDFNHTGSLARRIHYIKHKQYEKSQEANHGAEVLKHQNTIDESSSLLSY
ncbi:hypothetical protein DGG96_10680 [Legionella qingyii]|uniref:RavJ-like C-terminal domain-containing protein n=1 Tax=Legionella qingyii TaxID=2184757 RepID=A0A317U2W7_9GAMM|nr:DUF5617 domain-containing protein [Legionella qingyii]PWY55575.1 hypothetical protein DGG96_10680 [Legionella qingyii]RUR21830.1 hypothetical protein ELY20_11490 [Legionella qingyii]RUR25243.1 hypothetical protein ELY16_09865 [Legionella qingyii]